MSAHAPHSRQLTRIGRVLHYIHNHLDHPLSVELLAAQSCWSRWQLQRVFLEETGLTVANYVRELKLSRAAEALIDGRERIVDLALRHGFTSEASFCRAFKQQFGCTPGRYRQRGLRVGLRAPLCPEGEREAPDRLLPVRIESRPAFVLGGTHGQVRGLFASAPDFQQQVPALWQQLAEHYPPPLWGAQPRIGAVDVTSATEGVVEYWAGLPQPLPGLATLSIPAQEYAVLTQQGDLRTLPDTLRWFIRHWLPGSRYRGLDGIELEIYPAGYRTDDPQARMEYWLPIAPR